MSLRDATEARDSSSIWRSGPQTKTAASAFGAHALHDGYTDLVYVMLPIWQAEFGLGYAALGLLRGAFSGVMAGFQIPAGRLAERFGGVTVLAAGTALTAAAYCFAGASTGLAMLLAALVLGGLGSSTQHPIASEMVAHAFQGPRSLKALGLYNFSGDIGKMSVPALGALMLTVLPWRSTMVILGLAGFAIAAAIFLLTPRPAGAGAAAHAAAERTDIAAPAPPRHGFPLLLSIGVLDSATRMAFLTFLPFVLIAKGAGLPTIGAALTLVFAGGAFGKLVCTFIGQRFGAFFTVILTETATALGILALIPLGLEAALTLLPLIGVALNGTSSVLYGSVPALVEPHKRARAFSIFYTGTIGSGAVSPLLFGAVGDALSLVAAVVLVACLALLTLPLAVALRPALFARA